MLKKLSAYLLLLSVLLLCLPAAGLASDCWYFDAYGDHDWRQADVKLATCTEDGYYIKQCRKCGKIEKVITQPAFGHNWVYQSRQEPTCTDLGYTFYECANCFEKKSVSIAPWGHRWYDEKLLEMPTCIQEGAMRTRCSRCNVPGLRILPIDKDNHIFGPWTVIVPPTDHSMGQRTRTCTQCGKENTQSFYPEGTLYFGMTDHPEVAEMQQLLTDLGFMDSKIDGNFGKKTQKSVTDFQQAQGLEMTGVAFPQTRNVLSAVWNEKMNPEAAAVPQPEPTAVPAEKETTPEPTALPDKKEDDPEPTALPEASAADEAPKAAFCHMETAEDGSERLVYCETHQKMADSYAARLAAAEDDDARMLTLTLARAELTEQIEALYNQYAEAAKDEEKALIAAAKGAFFVSVNTQEGLWKMSAPDQPLKVARQVYEMLLSQCADLCMIIHTLP